jgi:hypothetical protein
MSRERRTKRLAEAWLRDVLDQARGGALPGMVRTGVTFAEAAAEWLRYVEQDRGRKPSMLSGYRPALNAEQIADRAPWDSSPGTEGLLPNRGGFFGSIGGSSELSGSVVDGSSTGGSGEMRFVRARGTGIA